nr:unnamed protein product [Callosobruchus analis]
MPLRKWASNHREILDETEGLEDKQFESIDQNSKILGLSWNATTDVFCYPTEIRDTSDGNKTNNFGKLFDPLGLINPIIIKTKMILQTLWREGSEWDEPVTDELRIAWAIFVGDLNCISNISIPRQISLPKLELSGVLLLMKSVEKVEDCFATKFAKRYFWSDSTVSLCWIKGEPSHWKTFVVNRVTQIQDKFSKDECYYVPSELNPADIRSQGTSVNIFNDSSFWWNGPSYLLKHEDDWPKNENVVLTKSWKNAN